MKNTKAKEAKQERFKQLELVLIDIIKAEKRLSGLGTATNNRKYNIDELAILSYDKEKTSSALKALYEVFFGEIHCEHLEEKLIEILGSKEADSAVRYTGMSYGLEFDEKIVLGNRLCETSSVVLCHVQPDRKLSAERQRSLWHKLSTKERRKIIIKACDTIIRKHTERLRYLKEL